jgi:hypothetical protein
VNDVAAYVVASVSGTGGHEIASTPSELIHLCFGVDASASGLPPASQQTFGISHTRSMSLQLSHIENTFDLLVY